MATLMSKRLLNYLTGQVPVTQTTTAMQHNQKVTVSYFDEGPGFVFLKHLAEGAEGWVCLVRSLEDHQLYVRKENFKASPFDKGDGAPPEVEIANVLQNIPSTIQLHGWFRYKAEYATKTKPRTFCVTYWTYCNSNDLLECKISYLKSACEFPEKWAAQWLASMLKTLVELHRKGIAHSDAHVGNWFIHRRSSTADPEILLGDFGLCESISENDTWSDSLHWAVLAAGDFEHVIKGMRSFAGTYERLRVVLTQIRGIIQGHNDYLKDLGLRRNTRGRGIDLRTSGSEFDTMIDSIAETIKEYAWSVSAPSPEQDLLKETRVVSEHNLPMLSGYPSAKAWKSAVLEDGKIATFWESGPSAQQARYTCEEGK